MTGLVYWDFDGLNLKPKTEVFIFANYAIMDQIVSHAWRLCHTIKIKFEIAPSQRQMRDPN